MAQTQKVSPLCKRTNKRNILTSMISTMIFTLPTFKALNSRFCCFLKPQLRTVSGVSNS